MLAYHNINPVAFSIGSFLQVHWYGLMYLFAFLGGWALLRLRAKKQGSLFSVQDVEDLVTWIVLGVLLGGRLGYILFYDLPSYLEHPLEIFQIWKGGMSFHGGFIGVLVAMCYWSKKRGHNFVDTMDFIAPVVPLGLLFGRIGNFINGELWGTASNVPWAMVFPTGGNKARHPSQLYEAFTEGLLLFIILWVLSQKKRTRGYISALFCIGYATARSFCEIYRVPDAQYGYFFGFLTMGQILCIPMFILGFGVLYWGRTQEK